MSHTNKNRKNLRSEEDTWNLVHLCGHDWNPCCVHLEL
jgi:hypothetical protein